MRIIYLKRLACGYILKAALWILKAERVLCLPNCFLQVFYADYGNTEMSSADKIMELAPQFSELPCQGLFCKPDTIYGLHADLEAYKEMYSYADVTGMTGCVRLNAFVKKIENKYFKFCLRNVTSWCRLQLCALVSAPTLCIGININFVPGQVDKYLICLTDASFCQRLCRVQ